jgi:hypothetical protein
MLAAFFQDGQPSLHPTISAPHWDDLLQQASSQGLLPALHHQVVANNLSHNIPDEIQTLFSTAESLNAERNQAILAEAVHACQLLNQIDIYPVALKGLAYLLTSVYPNPAARYLLDVDLLLPADQIPRAAVHLYKNGYYQSESAIFLQFRHHHPAIRRPGSPSFEIHHQLVIGGHNRLLTPAALLARAQPLTYNGATFIIPSPTDLVNHLILHSQLAHPYPDRIFPPLRALLDLAQLQTRFGDEIDWHALAQTYAENRQSATLILHLHHANQVLGLPIPPPIPTTLPFLLRLRYKRRLLLNRHPKFRFFDPIYLLMTLFSRRVRLLPLFLKTPSSWPNLLGLLTRRDFYQNLLR